MDGSGLDLDYAVLYWQPGMNFAIVGDAAGMAALRAEAARCRAEELRLSAAIHRIEEQPVNGCRKAHCV
jgi:hypothetical protein